MGRMCSSALGGFPVTVLVKELGGPLGGIRSESRQWPSSPRGTDDGKWLVAMQVSALQRAAAATLTVGEGSRTVLFVYLSR